MARLVHETSSSKRGPNTDTIHDLTRLLSRLQQNILHANADRERRLRQSEYERNKASINLEYARSLLTRLEQDALSIKIQSKRQEAQIDLNQKREIYEQVSERLRELEDMADSDSDSDDGEDVLAGIINTPSQSSGDIGEAEGEGAIGDQAEEDEGEATLLYSTRIPDPEVATFSRPPQMQAPITTTATSTEPSLRSRGVAPQTQSPSPDDDYAYQDTATTTGTSQTQIQAHIQPSYLTTPSTNPLSTETTEAILDNQREEQDQLTLEMVAMAQQLKASSQAFEESLQKDADALNAASTGMDKSEQSIGGVSGRMKTLSRLTEGKGWIGRMLLYAQIAGLSVFVLLLVFVFPKLRF
ncbi:hypothetical protein F5Y18DRAFT_392360 [Xylariaceae sp. FL1019]|nr:hypothetical protein F5Y18DRAFT_392360 [Xylariaceae sp. FL1019]